MTANEMCLSGALLSSPIMDDYIIVDFVLHNSEGVNVVMWAGWWEQDWSKDFGLTIIHGDLVETPHGFSFKTSYGLMISLSEFDTDLEARNLFGMRLAADSRRAEYFNALDQLSGNLNDLEFTEQIEEWKKVISARPVITPGDYLISKNSISRFVGFVALLNSAGQKVDGLVIDELGNAATKSGNTWLESIASQWISFTDSDRPEVEEFLSWVATQDPHDGNSVGIPNTAIQEGLVQVLAMQ